MNSYLALEIKIVNVISQPDKKLTMVPVYPAFKDQNDMYIENFRTILLVLFYLTFSIKHHI